MRDVTLRRAVFGVEKTVIEWIEFDQDAELLVAHVGRRRGIGAGVWGVSRSEPWIGRRRGSMHVAGPGPGDDPCGAGGRRAEGEVPHARGGGCCGAVGTSRHGPYLRLR